MSDEKDGVSRRAFLAGSAGLAAAGAAGSEAEAQYGRPGGVPKPRALYQWHPNGPERCGGCVHFLPRDACEIVRGEISPRGWCRFFRPARRRGYGGPGRY